MEDGGFATGKMGPAIERREDERDSPPAGQGMRPHEEPADRWPRTASSPETGRVIHNPISGERIIIRQSSAQTDGQSLVFDLFLPPGGRVPAGHVHPIQEERFTVMAGRMRFRLGWRAILAGPGEVVSIPRGTAHWFGNAGAEVAHARVEVRPALRMEELFESSEALGLAARRGGRMPHPADLARFLLQFQREVAVPHAPAFLVQALLTPLAWLGERRARKRGPHGPE